MRMVRLLALIGAPRRVDSGRVVQPAETRSMHSHVALLMLAATRGSFIVRTNSRITGSNDYATRRAHVVAVQTASSQPHHSALQEPPALRPVVHPTGVRCSLSPAL